MLVITMNNNKIKLFKFFIIFLSSFCISQMTYADVGFDGKGKATCGDLAKNQKLCGTGSATFESNAIGTCPSGSFADVGAWGCYTCPSGFDRGVASVKSDRACTKETVNKKLPQWSKATKVGSACGVGFHNISNDRCYTCPKGYERSFALIGDNNACFIPAYEKFSKARQKGAWGTTKCASGYFGDPNGGCYRCPTGYNRTLDSVTTKTACSKGIFGPFAKTSKKGSWTLAKTCAKGTFGDPNGKCYTCPSGYKRSAYPVTDKRACSMLVKEKTKKAKLEGVAACQDGEIKDYLMDVEKGGACYTCPKSYDRTILRIDSNEACETTPSTTFSVATKVTGLTCPEGEMFDPIATTHKDVKAKLKRDKVPSKDYETNDWGTCWSCPPGATRSWSSVTANDACVLADIGWELADYIHVGLFGLNGSAQVVLDIINEENDLNSLIEGTAIKLHENNIEKYNDFIADAWVEIATNPEYSPYIALAAFAKLQSYAKSKSLKRHERQFLEDFSDQVSKYRVAMANEALKIYKVWEKGAAQRFVDPRFLNRPEVVVQRVAWASIGVVSPPVSPPDFASLTYELEDDWFTESPLILGIGSLENIIEHDILVTLMPYDPVGNISEKAKEMLKTNALGTLGASMKGAIMAAKVSTRSGGQAVHAISTTTAKAAALRFKNKLAAKAAAKTAGIVAGKVSQSMLAAIGSLGPQIAVSLLVEFASQWLDFIFDSLDAEPALKANIAQAKQKYDVSRKLASSTGGLQLRADYKTIMNENVRPSASHLKEIEDAVKLLRE
jgi:hypothetical protein